MAKTPYQLWKEEQEKKKRGEVQPSRSPRNPIQYTNPTYKGESATRRESYQWEKDNLKPLSNKQYGRSYNDKFSNWAKKNGLDEREAREFRRWMDAKDDGVKTKASLTDNILTNLNKRNEADAERIKNRPKQEKPKKKKEKKKPSLANDILSPLKRFGQAINPFDDVSFTEAFRRNVQDALSTDRSKVTKETTRGLTRIANTSTLGALDEIYKRTNGERAPQFKNDDRSTGGKVADFGYDALGYLIPGIAAVKGARALGLGAKEAKGLSKLAQIAKEGAIVGSAMGAAEVGIREGLNPKDYNWKQNLGHVGIGTAAGAIADPALHGLGILARKGFEKAIPGDFPKFNGEVSSALLERLKPVSRSSELVTPSYRALNKLLNNPSNTGNELLKPIEQAPYGLERLKNQLRSGRDYEPITPMKGNGGPLIRLKEPITQNSAPVNIPNPKELVKQQINMNGKKEKDKWSFDKFMTAWVDDLRPLEKATKDLGGKDLEFDKNPYTQARLARGVAGKAETYLKGGIYTPDGKKVGKSLQEIIKPIENKMDDFLAYATSKRALDYDEKGLTAGIKPKDVEGISDRQLAEATIRQIEAEAPEIKAVHEELLNYNNTLIDELVDAGVLSREAVDSIREQNPNYIPMFRVQEPKVRGFQPLTNPKKTFANLGEPIKKRTGSEKEIINPIESIIKNTYLTLNMAERNRVGRSLLELVEGSGDNTWGRVVKVDKGLSVDEVADSLDVASKTAADDGADAIDNLFKGKGNKVYVYRDGQKVELELQEDLYKAMLSLDAQKQNFFIKMLAVPTRTLRAGAVLSPDFGPVNIFRDQLSALINSKYGFVPIVDLAKGLASVIKRDDIYWQWKNNGGANSVLSSLDREYLQQDLRKLVKEPFDERLKRNLSNKREIPLKALDKVISPLRKVSEITEEATRVGEFKKGLKKGATPKEAAFASRDLIDFNRAGNLGRQYNQVTAFFNAAVQSMDKLARTFKENPVGATTKALMGITLPSVVAYMYNKDEEWYKEIPQRERDLYWHFKAGDQIYKLPKPFEAGVLFGTAAERFLDFMETQDPKAFEDFSKTVRDTFTPNWIPTAIQPWIEVYGNKSFMFDSPIVPRREEDLLPEDQYGPYQSELSKSFGKLTKTSPRKAEHVFRGYTGGLGKYFLGMTDVGAEAVGKERPELPDRGLADMPIVNRFVVKNLEGNNQSVNDFYKRLDKLRRHDKSAEKNNKENPKKDIFKAINKISREISKLQKEKRAIIEDPNMSGKTKAEEIKRIDIQITELAKEGNGL